MQNAEKNTFKNLLFQSRSYKRRIFAASFYCLFAFFARYSVHYGHDCETINPWQKENIPETAALPTATSHCHDEKKETHSPEHHSGDEHKHSECQVCHSYEELVQSIFEEYSPSLKIFISKHETITETSLSSPSTDFIKAYHSRGPPVKFSII
ncbi:MAG: hypothetical protein OEZ34_08685 [Spirochaetia bacterium]|nr:hypothetical protein [Spirochaetia bacterium]